MQSTGPYRLTAVFDKYFNEHGRDDRVLFLPQSVVMRGKCPSSQQDHPECQRLKTMKTVEGEDTYLGLTTVHFATELWKDWKQDRRRLY